jgi:copper chaperone
MRRITLHITGMSCGHCLHAVNEALTSKPGVQLESLRIGQAVVSYDEQRTDPAAIEALIAGAGYAAVAAPSDAGAAEERR